MATRGFEDGWPVCRWEPGDSLKTKTPDETGSGTDDGALAPRDIFGVFANDRCRYLLSHLDQHVGGGSFGELAEWIALREDDTTYEHYERFLTGLHHVQLPKPVDAGLVRYEHDCETVTGTEAITQVKPYLDLAMAEDLR